MPQAESDFAPYVGLSLENMKVDGLLFEECSMGANLLLLHGELRFPRLSRAWGSECAELTMMFGTDQLFLLKVGAIPLVDGEHQRADCK